MNKIEYLKLPITFALNVLQTILFSLDYKLEYDNRYV